MTRQIAAPMAPWIQGSGHSEEAFRRQTIGEVMTVSPIAVSVDTLLGDVACAFERFHISGAPVVDRGGALAGVISQSDLLRVRANERLWGDWPWLEARHQMTTPPIVVREETPLDEAIELMERRGVHRLVVVAPDGEEPVGIFSTSDLVGLLAQAPKAA